MIRPTVAQPGRHVLDSGAVLRRMIGGSPEKCMSGSWTTGEYKGIPGCNSARNIAACAVGRNCEEAWKGAFGRLQVA